MNFSGKKKEFLSKSTNLTPFQTFFIDVLKMGKIPKHVAVMLDGNRRYGKKFGMDAVDSHYLGGIKVWDVAKWCLYIGVTEFTVFAFSIHNFRRSKSEVEALDLLFQDQAYDLLRNLNRLQNMGVGIRVVGRLTLLSDDLRQLLSEVVEGTKNNKDLFLNIAICYTGRDEISRAASHITSLVRNNELSPEDITEDLVSSMVLGEPDLLIRTSGAVRLSDFMIWQISNTVLYFEKVLWPEFTFWHFVSAIIHYQRQSRAEQKKQPKQTVTKAYIKPEIET